MTWTGQGRTGEGRVGKNTPHLTSTHAQPHHMLWLLELAGHNIWCPPHWRVLLTLARWHPVPRCRRYGAELRCRCVAQPVAPCLVPVLVPRLAPGLGTRAPGMESHAPPACTCSRIMRPCVAHAGAHEGAHAHASCARAREGGARPPGGGSLYIDPTH